MAPSPEPVESRRDGIEKGARETRLELKLRGVVASTEEGLGHAIIEYRKQQAVYAVEDKLPVSGNVVLAKVMPRQVVLDNAGTYELLTLFEETGLDEQVAAVPPLPPPARRSTGDREVQRRDDAQTTALASSFRDRLYQDPQSLAEVVNVSAVRSYGVLLGYRVSPGEQRQQPGTARSTRRWEKGTDNEHRCRVFRRAASISTAPFPYFVPR